MRMIRGASKLPNNRLINANCRLLSILHSDEEIFKNKEKKFVVRLENLTLTASTQIGVAGGLLCEEMNRQPSRGMKEFNLLSYDSLSNPSTINAQLRKLLG